MSTLAKAGRLPLLRRRRHAQNWELIVGGGLLAALLLIYWLLPLFYTESPIAQNLSEQLTGPNRAAWLGTDHLGRDVFARVLHAGRLDLVVAAATVVTPLIVGVTIGCIAGYFGGAIDALLMRLVDVVVAFPFYILVIAFVFVMGTGLTSFVVAVALVEWVAFARIVRGEVSHLRTREFVTAARLAGFSHMRIMRRHILPSVIVHAIHYAAADVVFILLALVSLGFLGLGAQPPTPEWGAMIADAQPYLSTQWWLTAAPGFAIALGGIAFALIGDGLAARWDPR